MENEQIAKRAFWLAYQASPVMGMGILQKRDDATEETIWADVHREGTNSADGDYVFGRMMKLGISWTQDTIEVNRGREPRADYQGWAGKYKNSADLLEAAMGSLTEPVKA